MGVFAPGEVTGVVTGLGAVMNDGRMLGHVDIVLAAMIVIAAAGKLTDLSCSRLAGRTARRCAKEGRQMSEGLVIDGISRTFLTENGAVVPALEGLSLCAPAGQITALLGPSGCGKSTLLNIIAGFDRPDAGAVRYAGRPLAQDGGKCGMVFQTPALFPWLTVAQNVEFGLKRKKIPRTPAW